MMNINGNWFNIARFKEETLYSSPYIVAKHKGYTKHYYAGSERIASAIRLGGLANIDTPLELDTYHHSWEDKKLFIKRYKYCGKERDEETGLYYYGMRYYTAWLCRFINVDPLQFKYPYYTPFQYAGNMPITYIDLDGREESLPVNPSQSTIYKIIRPDNKFSWNYEYNSKIGWIGLGGEGILEGVEVKADRNDSETRIPEIKNMSLIDMDFNRTVNEVDPMSGLGIVLSQQQYNLQVYTGEIVHVRGFNLLELWFETPSNNMDEFFVKMVVNVMYGILNSPYSYFTGKTISGSYLNPIQRTDAFVDFAPGLVLSVLSKSIPVIQTAGDGFQAYNKVKKEATEFGHIFEGKDWQKEASRLYQTNKRNQHLIEDIEQLNNLDKYLLSPTKEISKKMKSVN